MAVLAAMPFLLVSVNRACPGGGEEAARPASRQPGHTRKFRLNWSGGGRGVDKIWFAV